MYRKSAARAFVLTLLFVLALLYLLALSSCSFQGKRNSECEMNCTNCGDVKVKCRVHEGPEGVIGAP